MENGKTTRKMVLGSFTTTRDKLIKVILEKDIRREKVHTHGVMEINLLAIIKMERKMVMAYLQRQVEQP